MSWAPLQFVGGAYSDDAKPWTCQDTVNYIPVMAEKEGTRSPSILRDAPGLRLFAKTGPNVAIRGLHNAEGYLVMVAGTHLCNVSSKGVVTKLGDVPGTGRVAFSHNQVTGGVQIVVANGPSGYVYDTAKSTFTQITDPGFPGSISVGYMDSYIIGVEPLGRYWMTSDLADATSYNTLNRYEAESAPDKIVGLIVSHEEVVVFGERTIEFFEDTGADTITFQTKQGLQAQVGAASRFAIVQLDNGIVWLGNDGSFYMLNGYTPTRISTHAIESAISGLDWSQCFATVFNDRGHKVAYFTFPDGHTWGYDASTQEWHRRESYGLKRWRLNDLVYWNGSWIGGDFSNGDLYKLDWDVSDENGEPLERRRVGGVVSATENKLRVDAVAFVFDTGRVGKSGVVTLPAFTISGDLSNGGVGDTKTGKYIAAHGIAPVNYAVTSGTFPPGITLAADGSWSGTYTTANEYSWTVTATDVFGNKAVLHDAATVVTSPTLAVKTNGVSQYLYTPYATPILGSGDFTIQARVSLSAPSTMAVVSGRVLAWSTQGWALQITSTGAIEQRMSIGATSIDSSANMQSAGGLVGIGVMHHIAWTRHGDVFTLWLDGASVASGTFTGTINETNVANLSLFTSLQEIQENIFDGYIDWFALTVGTCLYTAPFTPPASAADVATITSALDFNEAVGSTSFTDLGGFTWTNPHSAAIAEFIP